MCDLFAPDPREMRRLIDLFRRGIFESFVKTGAPGLVFSYYVGL